MGLLVTSKIKIAGIWVMPQWIQDLLCGLDLHTWGTWAYDFPQLRTCSQRRTCLQCGKRSSFRFEHKVEYWGERNWWLSEESGVCIRCKERVTRHRDPPWWMRGGSH